MSQIISHNRWMTGMVPTVYLLDKRSPCTYPRVSYCTHIGMVANGYVHHTSLRADMARMPTDGYCIVDDMCGNIRCLQSGVMRCFKYWWKFYKMSSTAFNCRMAVVLIQLNLPLHSKPGISFWRCVGELHELVCSNSNWSVAPVYYVSQICNISNIRRLCLLGLSLCLWMRRSKVALTQKYSILTWELHQHHFQML